MLSRVDLSTGAMAGGSCYAFGGDTACRAATCVTTCVTTCADATPTGALLAFDNEGRLTAWQNIANVTTPPTSTPAREEALYSHCSRAWREVEATK